MPKYQTLEKHGSSRHRTGDSRSRVSIHPKGERVSKTVEGESRDVRRGDCRSSRRDEKEDRKVARAKKYGRTKLMYSISILSKACHPERQRRVSFVAVEILRGVYPERSRGAQNDTHEEDS